MYSFFQQTVFCLVWLIDSYHVTGVGEAVVTCVCCWTLSAVLVAVLGALLSVYSTLLANGTNSASTVTSRRNDKAVNIGLIYCKQVCRSHADLCPAPARIIVGRGVNSACSMSCVVPRVVVAY